MSIKTGATVRLIQPVIEGSVRKREIGDDDRVRVLVEWTEPGGETTQRWFDESALEVVEVAQ